MNLRDVTGFEGVSRTVLEARVRALVRVLDKTRAALNARLQGRSDNAHRNLTDHPDWNAKHDASVRLHAYETALEDVNDVCASTLAAEECR